MYKVTYGGKKGKTLDLIESPDLVAVRTKGNRKLENIRLSAQSRQALNAGKEVLAFPEAGVTVHRVKENQSETNSALESYTAPTEARDQMRSMLKQEPEIRFAGRVLQDAGSGAVMLYTENFFIKCKDSTPEAKCLALFEQYGLTLKSKLTFAQNAYFVEAPEGTGLKVFEIADQLLQEKIVEYCHPELVQERKSKLPAHPLQWHLIKTTINGKVIDHHVNITKAWEITKGAGVTIAVIDDGVDINHPEFAGRIVHPYDATENNEDPRPKDPEDSHGTACAGMACAAGLKDGASGTAPEANLMPIRLRSGLGSVNEANAFTWAADHGADVISCSWGPSDGDWWKPEDPLHQHVSMLPDSTRLAMNYAAKKGRNGRGCVILFAAGNGNESIDNDGYGSYAGVIAVAACNDSGKRCVYSDFGKAVWVSFPSGDYAHEPFQHPAPKTAGLRTTDRLGKPGYLDGDYVDSFGGTSGACPGMAGVVGLVLAANPELTFRKVKQLLRASCMKIDREKGQYDQKGHSIYYGYGRINAGKAVKKAVTLRKVKP